MNLLALLLSSSQRSPRHSVRMLRNYLGPIAYYLVRHLKHVTDTVETVSQHLLYTTPAHRKTRRHRRLALSCRYIRYLAAGYALQTASSDITARSRRPHKKHTVTRPPDVWSYESIVLSSSITPPSDSDRFWNPSWHASRIQGTNLSGGDSEGVPERDSEGVTYSEGLRDGIPWSFWLHRHQRHSVAVS
jgi:hypothetical protein